MKTYAPKIVRILLGLIMITIGLNKFLMFTEIPHLEGDGGILMGIYISSGFLKMVGALEIVGGIGLVLHKFLGVSIPLVTAIMFNATVFHLLYDPSGIGPAAFCFVLSVMVIIANRKRFAVVFTV